MKLTLIRSRAQSSAEYAMVILLVVAFITGISTFTKRAGQGKIAHVARELVEAGEETGGFGSEADYQWVSSVETNMDSTENTYAQTWGVNRAVNYVGNAFQQQNGIQDRGAAN